MERVREGEEGKIDACAERERVGDGGEGRMVKCGE